MNSDEHKQPASPLAHLFATVDRNVADLRSGEISGQDVRALARERRRKQWEAVMPLRGSSPPARPR